MTTQAIERFVAELSRELPGPRRWRDDLLEELHGGLWDAVDAYRREGLPTADAERRAVRECGTVAELAEEYRVELSALSGRRTAALLAVTMLAGIVAWDLVWVDAGSSPVPSVVHTWSGVVDLAGLVGGLAATAAMLMLVWVSRRWPCARQASRAVRSVNGFLVASGVIANLVILTGSLAMNLAMPDRALAMLQHSLPAAALSVASQVVVYLQARSLYRTVRLTYGKGRGRSGGGGESASTRASRADDARQGSREADDRREPEVRRNHGRPQNADHGRPGGDLGLRTDGARTGDGTSAAWVPMSTTSISEWG